MQAPDPGPGQRFRQALGMPELVSLGIGGTIGSGIFVVPGIAAGILGPWSLLAWVFVAVSAGCVMLSLAWVAARMGGKLSFYSMFSSIFGPRTAEGLILLYLVSTIFGIATIAAGIGLYLSFFGVAPYFIVELALIGLFCILNLWGISFSGATENVLTTLKIVPLVIIIVLLIPSVTPTNLTPTVPLSLYGFFATVMIVYWPFTGFEISAIPVDEVRDPRIISRALILVMVSVTSIYLLLNVALIGSSGSTLLAQSNAPVAAAVEAAFSTGGRFVAAVGIIAMLSAMNAYIIGGSRVLHSFAMARSVPLFSGLNERGTPTFPLLLTCAVPALLLYGTNRFSELAVISVLTTLVPYIFFCIASIRVVPGIIQRLVAGTGAITSATIIVLAFLI